MKAIEYTAVGLALLGAALISLHMREGFLVWLVSNSLWVVFGVKKRHWGLALQFVVFFLISAFGYWNWR